MRRETPKPVAPRWCVCPAALQVRVDHVFGETVQLNFPYCGRCGRNLASALQLVGAEPDEDTFVAAAGDREYPE